jgi:hypothetical protein
MENQLVAAFLKSFGSVVGYLVSYWVWRKTERKFLLHDWLSGTECVLCPNQSAPITDLVLPAWKLASHPTPQPTPAFLGRFRVHSETICPVNSASLSEQFRWFEGVDPQLNRTVWIAVSSDPTLELTQLQPKKSKTYRIRFLEEGTRETGRWFAFLAPDGVPLPDCLSLGVHLPWSQTRSVLQQAAQLIDQTSTDEKLPTSDRIWLDRRGRICLADFLETPLEPAASDVPSSLLAKTEDHLESDDFCVGCKESSLIRDICALAISPGDVCRRKHLKRHVKPTPLPVEALLPRKARKLCQSVVAKKYQPTLSQFLIDVHRVATGPSVVSSKARFFNAALSLAFLIPVIAFAWFYLSLPSLLFCIELAQDIKSLKSLERLAQLSVQGLADDRDWSGASETEVAFCVSPQGRLQIGETLESLTEQLQASHYKLGWIEQTVWAQIPLLGQDLQALTSFQLKSDELAGIQAAANPLGENEQPTSDSDFERADKFTVNLGTQKFDLTNLDNRWNSKRLRKALNRVSAMKPDGELAQDAPRSTEAASFADSPPLTFNLLGWVIVACAIWTWLTLGGIAQYFTGICFVKRDGRRIGVLRSALRACLLYLPVFLLAYWILHWPLNEPRDIFWTTQLKRLFFALPLIYLATTLLRSNRTPLDRITNTAAIPR